MCASAFPAITSLVDNYFCNIPKKYTFLSLSHIFWQILSLKMPDFSSSLFLFNFTHRWFATLISKERFCFPPRKCSKTFKFTFFLSPCWTIVIWFKFKRSFKESHQVHVAFSLSLSHFSSVLERN